MGQMLRAISETGAKRTGNHAGGKRQKYILDEPGRRLMQSVYGNPEYGNVSESIDYLESRLRMPREVITDYAQQMGLCRTRDDYWTQSQLAYLEKYYQQPAGKRASIKSIAQRLGRTEAAVRLKAKRMKFRRSTGDAYTMNALADALGCDQHKVKRWIDRGWLRADIDESRDNGQHSITPGNIRRFIIAHPSEIDHRRADWLWLLDILVGDEYGGMGALTETKGEKP